MRSLALCASSPAPASRAVLELERKSVALQQEIESKKPEEIRLKEEISHTERRRGGGGGAGSQGARTNQP